MSNKDYEEARKKVAEASQQVTALLKSIGLDEQGDQFEALQKSLDDQDPQMNDNQDPSIEGGAEDDMSGDEYQSEMGDQDPAAMGDESLEGDMDMDDDLDQDSDADELTQHLEAQDDEYLAQIAEVAQSILAQRQGASEMGAPEGDMSEDPASLEKNMQSDYMKMTKSLIAQNKQLMKQVSSLSKSVTDLKSSKTSVVVSQKPAATNVEVLEKSAPKAPTRLNAQETAQKIMGEIARGNRGVSSSDVHTATLAKSNPAALKELQDRLEIEQGLSFTKQS